MTNQTQFFQKHQQINRNLFGKKGWFSASPKLTQSYLWLGAAWPIRGAISGRVGFERGSHFFVGYRSRNNENWVSLPRPGTPSIICSNTCLFRNEKFLEAKEGLRLISVAKQEFSGSHELYENGAKRGPKNKQQLCKKQRSVLVYFDRFRGSRHLDDLGDRKSGPGI